MVGSSAREKAIRNQIADCRDAKTRHPDNVPINRRLVQLEAELAEARAGVKNAIPTDQAPTDQAPTHQAPAHQIPTSTKAVGRPSKEDLQAIEARKAFDDAKKEVAKAREEVNFCLRRWQESKNDRRIPWRVVEDHRDRHLRQLNHIKDREAFEEQQHKRVVNAENLAKKAGAAPAGPTTTKSKHETEREKAQKSLEAAEKEVISAKTKADEVYKALEARKNDIHSRPKDLADAEERYRLRQRDLIRSEEKVVSQQRRLKKADDFVRKAAEVAIQAAAREEASNQPSHAGNPGSVPDAAEGIVTGKTQEGDTLTNPPPPTPQQADQAAQDTAASKPADPSKRQWSVVPDSHAPDSHTANPNRKRKTADLERAGSEE